MCVMRDRPIPEVQTMQSSPPRSPSADDLKQWADFRKQFGEPKISPPFDRLPAAVQKLHLWASSLPPRATESDNYFAEELAQMYQETQKVPAPLGDKPLVTIVAGRPDPASDMTQTQWDALVSEKVKEKRGYAQLSHNSKVVFDAKSGHSVHLEDPDTVVNAIRDVQTAIAKHVRLTQ
jgi:pimeloyl-ACP methyl ester carboxylesterase